MSQWIWYPGDMELYYALKQNFSRVERGFGWPAFWKSDGFRNRVVFRRKYELKEETEFCVYSYSIGYVLVNDRKYPFGHKIKCSSGNVSVSIHAASVEFFPSVFAEGDVIYSDEGWMAEDYAEPPKPAGCGNVFIRKEQNPAVWEYSEKRYEPVIAEEITGGVLFGFETELTAVLEVKKQDPNKKIIVCCGESKEEALDINHCYYSWVPDKDGKCPCCAVRFAFIPETRKNEISVSAVHKYVDIPTRASFKCDDELLNKIWQTAEHTFKLCSGIFFLDGIKRDKWIWCGDAYQSIFVNQYLMADPDIDRRTLIALRGNDPIITHINTIVDYSLYWILGIKAHYDAYADEKFVRMIYPKMISLMEFIERQLDENGFLIGRKGDWIYIDWAEFDKEGAFCPEQMLLAKCYEVMKEVSGIVGESYSGWEDKRIKLEKNIDKFFWNEDKKAYIDSFASGRNNVTRHANIFAVLFDIADDKRKNVILESVLLNDNIPPITTPYFKFYELEALGKMGKLEYVMNAIKSYWGGMIQKGAVTFWEEYDPNVPDEEMYDMYGDKFGKSLCHAWGASPIYLLEKYFLGVKPLSAGYRTYEANPRTEFFRSFDCKVPVNKGDLKLCWNGKELKTDYFESVN